MPSVAYILSNKGGVVHTIDPDATALDAINKMNQHKIGALLVTRGQRIVGMFTERDVLCRVAGELKSAADVTVAQVMTREVFSLLPETDIDEAAMVMKEKRIRHMPVCGPEGEVIGLISIGDVNAHHVSQAESTIEFLSEYIYGRA